jgi:hypothetical protein
VLIDSAESGAMDTPYWLIISATLALIFLCVFDPWYWYHDGKRIVPVTVQVWDCLCSPLGTALVMERVGDGSVGAIDISKSGCPGLSG